MADWKVIARTTFRATPFDPAFKCRLETGKRTDPARGNPMQNTGTVRVSFKGSGVLSQMRNL